MLTKYRLYCIVTVLLLCVFAYSQGSVISMQMIERQKFNSASSLNPVPTPLYLKTTGSIYCLSEDFDFIIKGQDCSLLRNYIHYIYKYISNPVPSTVKTGCSLIMSAIITVVKPCNGSASKKVYPSEDMDESYKLNITSKGGMLEAPEVWGVMRGLETFAQLLFRTASGQVGAPETVVIDKPRFRHRGLMLDTSRHFLSKEKIFENLELMAMNKMNVFHWHIVDDQSFPFDSYSFAQLSRKGAYNPHTRIYTQMDVADVIEHGRRLGIRVMPEFDSPGHTQSWGKGQAGLLTPCYTGTTPNGKFGPVDPSKAANFDFLKALFAEVTRVFPDKFLHVGGDEVSFSCWQSNPQIAAFMKAEKIKTYSDLESFYVNKILQIVASVQPEGKDLTSVVWQEVFDNNVEIPNKTVVHIWKSGDAWQNEMTSVTKGGYKALLSSCWYLNYIQYGTDYNKYYSCDPQKFNGTTAQKDLVIGGEACMWGEYVDDSNVISRTWPRASAVAEALWTMPFQKDFGSFQNRMHSLQCRMRRRGYDAEPINGPSSCESPVSP